MAATFAIGKSSSVENLKVVVATITMDNSYLTGGELVAASDFGLRGIFTVICGAPPQGGWLPAYNPVAGTIKLFQSTTGAPAALVEVASTTDVSTAVIPVIVLGFA
jgi:hypothetical protein